MILRAAWTSESWPALKPHERKEPATTKNGGEKNGEMGKLGQDRLEVRWEAAMFLFNLVIWNVWLFLFDYLAKCFVEVVVIMFGFNEGRFCWGCFVCYDFRFMFNVFSLPLMFFLVGVLGLFCPELSLWLFGLNGGRICLGCCVLCLCLGGWLLHNIFY